MRVLLDEQLPRQLARELIDHEVRTVQQQRWAGLKNGELLQRAAEAGYDVFITADQNIEFQQNLVQARLFILVLVALSNALEELLPLVPAFSRKSRGDKRVVWFASMPNSRVEPTGLSLCAIGERWWADGSRARR